MQPIRLLFYPTRHRYKLADIAALSDDVLSALEASDPIAPGDVVKVVALAAGGRIGESFWVLVTDVQGEGDRRRITGEVNNHLVNTNVHWLDAGDRIAFEPRHVKDVYRSDTGPAPYHRSHDVH